MLPKIKGIKRRPAFPLYYSKNCPLLLLSSLTRVLPFLPTVRVEGTKDVMEWNAGSQLCTGCVEK